MRNIGNAILSLLVLGGLLACEEETLCPIDKQIDLRAGFYQRLESSDVDTSLNNLTLYGIGAGDSLYQDSSNISELQLPLSPYADSSSFVLMAEGQSETLTFYYERELVFFSEDCGFIHEFTLRNVRHSSNLIDSMAIVEEQVNTEDNEHIKIYL